MLQVAIFTDIRYQVSIGLISIYFPGDLQIIGNITKYKLGSELETVWNWILQCRQAIFEAPNEGEGWEGGRELRKLNN